MGHTDRGLATKGYAVLALVSRSSRPIRSWARGTAAAKRSRGNEYVDVQPPRRIPDREAGTHLIRLYQLVAERA